jgi:hypothetical protein
VLGTGAGGLVCNCEIGRVIGYTAALNTNQLNAIETGLKSAWGTA